MNDDDGYAPDECECEFCSPEPEPIPAPWERTGVEEHALRPLPVSDEERTLALTRRAD